LAEDGESASALRGMNKRGGGGGRKKGGDNFGLTHVNTEGKNYDLEDYEMGVQSNAIYNYFRKSLGTMQGEGKPYHWLVRRREELFGGPLLPGGIK